MMKYSHYHYRKGTSSCDMETVLLLNLVFLMSVVPTFTRVSGLLSQNIFPLLQDLLQRRLQFAGQDAVFIAQLPDIAGRVNSSHVMPFTSMSLICLLHRLTPNNCARAPNINTLHITHGFHFLWSQIY